MKLLKVARIMNTVVDDCVMALVLEVHCPRNVKSSFHPGPRFGNTDVRHIKSDLIFSFLIASYSFIDICEVMD